MAVKALVQADAIIGLLFPEHNFIEIGVKLIREMALEEITTDRVVDVVKDQAMSTARELLNRLPNLQTATLGWLDQYQKGRFEIYLDTSDLSKEVDKLASFGRQLIVAIMLVGMIIGSAIGTSVIALFKPQGQYWNIISVLASIGFVVAMLVAILIILRLLWRWIRGANPMRD